MKIAIISAILLLSSLESFSQKTDSTHLFTKEEYLEKSKHQKTTAWILLGGGLASTFIGLGSMNFAGSSTGEVNNTPGAILFFTGIAATITSFHFFHVSKKNKKKAMAMTANIELKSNQFSFLQPTTQNLQPGNLVPSLRVKVRF